MGTRRVGEKEAKQIFDEMYFPMTPEEEDIKRIVALANGKTYKTPAGKVMGQTRYIVDSVDTLRVAIQHWLGN